MKPIKKIISLILCFAILSAAAVFVPAYAATSTVIVEDYVNIRSAPSTDSVVYCQTTTYIEAEYLGSETAADGVVWYHIRSNLIPTEQHEGYVSSQYARLVKPEEESTDFSNRIMIIDTVNVRKEPSTDYGVEVIAVHWPAAVECKGKKINKYGELWYNIVTAGGLDGYVRADYVAEYSYKYDENFEKGLLQFPTNYRDGLRYIHTLYPNWQFTAQQLPISVSTAISCEVGRKYLSDAYTSLPDDWRTTIAGRSCEPGYGFASEKAISYFMHPENFITPKSIFMFMQQSYDPKTQNEQGLRQMIKGTFIDSDEYVSIIMDAASQSGVNPYVIAGTIFQEQSKSGSELCFGRYTGYEGYYNFFNFGASGTSTEQIIQSGLYYASQHGWSSPRISIIEGAKLYADGYMNYGQDTYYYKNFNVVNEDWGFQYATNIHDSVNNALNVSDAYDFQSSHAVFKIPVYLGSDYGGESAHTHVFDGGAVTKPATLSEEGVMTFTCTGCGYKRTEVIPKLDPSKIKKGDINADGEINTMDGALLRMHFLDVRTLDNVEKIRADINGDNDVNSLDGALLRMHFLGIKPLE